MAYIKSYEEFKEAFILELKNNFNGEVVETTVAKNNATVDAVVLRNEGNAAPTIYPKNAYEDYLHGISLEELVAKALAYKSESISMDIATKDYILANVTFQLVDSSNNQALLEEFLNRPFNNLSILYGVAVEMNGMRGAYKVSHKNAESLGITEAELYAAAYKNTLSKCYMPSMPEVLARSVWKQVALGALDRDVAEQIIAEMELYASNMWVLSNYSQFHGAGSLVVLEDLLELREMSEESFVIFPSSIHEVILADISFLDMGVDGLLNMVSEVNGTEVAPEEVLTTCFFIYKDGKLEAFTANNDSAAFC